MWSRGQEGAPPHCLLGACPRCTLLTSAAFSSCAFSPVVLVTERVPFPARPLFLQILQHSQFASQMSNGREAEVLDLFGPFLRPGVAPDLVHTEQSCNGKTASFSLSPLLPPFSPPHCHCILRQTLWLGLLRQRQLMPLFRPSAPMYTVDHLYPTLEDGRSVGSGPRAQPLSLTQSPGRFYRASPPHPFSLFSLSLFPSLSLPA